MCLGIQGSSSYLKCNSNSSLDDSDSNHSVEDRFIELNHLKDQYQQNKEAIKNRFYRYTPAFATSLTCPEVPSNEIKSQQRPYKKPKALQVLHGISECDYERSFQRKQDQFKTFQHMQKLKSQMDKKKKQLELKNFLKNKNKRVKKGKEEKPVISASKSKEKIVKKCTENDILAERKIYPSLSIRNLFII